MKSWQIFIISMVLTISFSLFIAILRVMRYSIFSLFPFPFDQTKPGCTSQVRETL